MTKDELKEIDYSSWRKDEGDGWSEEELNFIIEKDCQCDDCGKHVSEMDDFPTINIEKDELLCEDCHTEEYYSTCPCCEDYYDKYETPDKDVMHCYISKDFAEENGMKGGIYKVLKFPIFWGDCLTSFDAFYNDSLELVKEIDITSVEKNIDWRNTGVDISADYICPSCVSHYKNENPVLRYYVKNSHFEPSGKYIQKYSNMSRIQFLNYIINERGYIERGY